MLPGRDQTPQYAPYTVADEQRGHQAHSDKDEDEPGRGKHVLDRLRAAPGHIEIGHERIRHDKARLR